jgi:hypothetical protein
MDTVDRQDRQAAPTCDVVQLDRHTHGRPEGRPARMQMASALFSLTHTEQVRSIWHLAGRGTSRMSRGTAIRPIDLPRPLLLARYSHPDFILPTTSRTTWRPPPSSIETSEFRRGT